jgi:hypothetical protein
VPTYDIEVRRDGRWWMIHKRRTALASKEDGVAETSGHSPQSFSARWYGNASVSLGRAAFVQCADIAQRVGMTPQLSS